jgi:penicillin-binding protein 1C
MLGQERLVHTLIQADFRQIARDERKLGLSMILGGCGTSLEELTSVFASFASSGIYRHPSFTVEDSNREGKRLFSPAASYMVCEILSHVNRPDFPLNWSATERMPKIAWKTGTSYGRRDGWSIGFNKRYTVGVWTGNFSGIGVPDLSGASIATPLLFRIFNTIDYDTDTDWFQQPGDCDIRQVCSETGMPPSSHCENITSDLFIPLVSSTQPCNNRRQVMVSENEKISYCQDCAPIAGYKRNWYRVVEPEMQSWFEDNRISFTRIPDHNPECERIFRGNAPFITSPVNGSEYLVSRTDPEPLQLVARTANDVGRVYWYINDKFYKASPPGEKQFFVPQEGAVKISCTDDKGRNRDVRIRVRYVRL